MQTTSEFTEAIEIEMRLAGIAFDRVELLAWTACMWPWIDDDPDAGRWAREFAEVVRVEQRDVEHRAIASR